MCCCGRLGDKDGGDAGQGAGTYACDDACYDQEVARLCRRLKGTADEGNDG